MKEYLDITNELTQVTKEYKIFQERYASVLSNLNEFNGAAAGLPSFRFSIENELILIEFIDRKFQVEFNYLRKPSGQLSIKESTNEKKNEVLAFQEFEANGDVMNSTLSLKEAIETMAVILNLVMSAVES
jgi:hypothetical protein